MHYSYSSETSSEGASMQRKQRGEISLTVVIYGESRDVKGRERRQQNKRPIRLEEETSYRGKGGNILQRKSPLDLTNRQHPPEGGNFQQVPSHLKSYGAKASLPLSLSERHRRTLRSA